MKYKKRTKGIFEQLQKQRELHQCNKQFEYITVKKNKYFRGKNTDNDNYFKTYRLIVIK